MKPTLAYALMLAAVLVYWYAQGRSRAIAEPAPGPEQRLESVSYAPFEKDQSPLGLKDEVPTFSAARIDADLALLARRFDGIRIYSTAGLEALPPIAAKHGLKVLLGAWVSADPVATEKELERVIEMVRRHPSSVRAVVVGNETLLRREVTGSQLAAYIRRVKDALPGVPVAYADVWEFWLRHPEVAPAVDLVLIHILPYWEDDPVSIHQAVAHVGRIRREMARHLPGKEIMIGETGWPSRGRMRAGALPSPVHQARFIRGFADLAAREGWSYNLIEAFDQPWKRANEGAVGGYWGLYDTHRRDKAVLSGPVSDYPYWPVLFGLTALVILLTLAILVRRPGANRIQWFPFWIIAAAGATLWVIQGHQFTVITRSVWETMWAVMVMVQAAIVYVLLLRAAAGGSVPEHLDLKSSLDLLTGRFPGSAAGGRLAALVSVNRLAGLVLALIALAGLCFDPRYRSFQNGGFLLPALGYVWFWHRPGQGVSPAGGLERLLALTLAAGALWVLIRETPLNWQAGLWAAACLLLAYPLWRQGRGRSLRPLLGSGAALVGALGGLLVLRHLMLHADGIVSLCSQDATAVLCRVRDILGVLMYHQVFGLAAVAMAVVAVWRGSPPLSLGATVAGMAALLFYNASLGAIGVVLSGLVLGAQKLAAAGRDGSTV
jgi:exo-beta-1,3-glucanase (GH17 family)